VGSAMAFGSPPGSTKSAAIYACIEEYVRVFSRFYFKEGGVDDNMISLNGTHRTVVFASALMPVHAERPDGGLSLQEALNWRRSA
jgi:hypothetical protein